MANLLCLRSNVAVVLYLVSPVVACYVSIRQEIGLGNLQIRLGTPDFAYWFGLLVLQVFQELFFLILLSIFQLGHCHSLPISPITTFPRPIFFFVENYHHLLIIFSNIEIKLLYACLFGKCHLLEPWKEKRLIK